MKYKLKKKFEQYDTTLRQGTVQKGESLTDQSQREETDIYACLTKYGASALVNKTQAQEFLYLDNTNRDMTLDEAVRMRKEMSDYFDQLPARVRKTFGDKADVFIEKYKKGEFIDFLATGVLSEDMVKALTPEVSIPENNTTVKPDVIKPDATTQVTGGTTNV